MNRKRPFDIHHAIQAIRQAVQPVPKAAMFALADEGFGTPFEMLVACIISIRTRDEVTMVCARRLFGLQARLHGQAAEMLDLPGARHVPAGGCKGASLKARLNCNSNDSHGGNCHA